MKLQIIRLIKKFINEKANNNSVLEDQGNKNSTSIVKWIREDGSYIMPRTPGITKDFVFSDGATAKINIVPIY